MNVRFRKMAETTAHWVGTPMAFLLSVAGILIWSLSGPFFGFSDTWQLVVNTTTTIITFLMVFLIQNTQNRDARAIHLKLDELIRATQGARNDLIDLEAMSDERLEEIHQEFCAIHERTGDLLERIEEHKDERKEAGRNKD